MIAAPRTAARVLFAGVLLLFVLPLTAGPAAAEPSGSPTSSPTPSPTPSPTSSPTSSPASAPKAPPAPPGPGTVTATATVDCSGEAVLVTAQNTTDAPVTVAAFLNAATVPAATLDIAASGTATATVKPGDGPFELVVRRLDTAATLATAEGFFSCPVRHDLAIKVRSGDTYTSGDICAVAFFRRVPGPLHGTVTVTGRGFTYTSVAGYTGPDQFDYECLTSESVFGTVRVTVLPPPATPSPATPPPAAAPQLPATGTGHLPLLLGTGTLLIAAGALTLRLARR